MFSSPTYYRSSLENYRSNNKSQHEITRHNTTQHDTTRVKYDTTRVTTRAKTTQHECNARQQHEYNKIQREYKGSSGSKNRALLHIFVIELYIFLSFFRNG